MTVHAQTDKRFRRSKHPTRRPRRAARRWWRVARGVSVACGAIFGVYQAAALLLAASFLSVDDIVVRGQVQLSEGEVLALVAELRGENILTLDLERYRQRLLASPWLRDGTLRRILPSRVEVHVHERRPVALARLDERLYLVDEYGTIIDEHGPRFASFDLPIVDGLATNAVGRPTVDAGRMALATRLLWQLATRPEVLDSISEIDVADPYDAVVLLNDDPALLHLGGDDFLTRLRKYAELGSTLREQVPNIDYVDLRFDQRLYVGPASVEPELSKRRVDQPASEPAVD